MRAKTYKDGSCWASRDEAEWSTQAGGPCCSRDPPHTTSMRPEEGVPFECTTPAQACPARTLAALVGRDHPGHVGRRSSLGGSHSRRPLRSGDRGDHSGQANGQRMPPPKPAFRRPSGNRVFVRRLSELSGCPARKLTWENTPDSPSRSCPGCPVTDGCNTPGCCSLSAKPTLVVAGAEGALRHALHWLMNDGAS
jgi:hypothetical protein